MQAKNRPPWRCAPRSDDTEADWAEVASVDPTNGTSLGANRYRAWTCEHRIFLLLGLDSRRLHLKPYVSRLVY